MDRPIFFSVIIPTFNAKSIVNKAIDSVLAQMYSNFEILVLDGFSDDGTVEVLKKYQDNRLRYISERDSGIYDAMNKGVALARGEWLYFLGADDVLHDDCVFLDVARFIELNEKDTAVVYGNVKIVGSNRWANDGDVYDGKFDLQKILKKNLCHQGVFYRTRFIRFEVGYYNLAYPVCADWDFNLRCWAQAPFRFIDRIMADFQAGGESTRKTGDSNFSNDYLNNILTYFGFNLFDPLINDRDFLQYSNLLALQRKQNPLKWLWGRLKTKLFISGGVHLKGRSGSS